MKNKITQVYLVVSKFDRRHIQLAYLVLALAGYIVLRSPYDGGTGPI